MSAADANDDDDDDDDNVTQFSYQPFEGSPINSFIHFKDKKTETPKS